MVGDIDLIYKYLLTCWDRQYAKNDMAGATLQDAKIVRSCYMATW